MEVLLGIFIEKFSIPKNILGVLGTFVVGISRYKEKMFTLEYPMSVFFTLSLKKKHISGVQTLSNPNPDTYHLQERS